MKERPILFSGEIVRAILSGRKTQTRRVIKPQPIDVDLVEILCNGKVHYRRPVNDKMLEEAESLPEYSTRSVVAGLIEHCPFGTIGDRLWVRETFWIAYYPNKDDDFPGGCLYRADKDVEEGIKSVGGVNWCPSIHMPRWASRIMLEITNVRVERVQDISEEDATKEGFIGEACNHTYTDPPGCCTDCMNTGFIEPPSMGFAMTWDSIYKQRGYGWYANPWVWVIEFKVVQP